MATMTRGLTEAPARLQVTALANAATTVAAAAYILCAVLALVAYEAYIGLFQPWAHGMMLNSLRPMGAWFQLSTFITGLITFGATVWLATAATAWLYNNWSRR